MAKKILGVDIGHDQLKLALVKGTHVLKTVSAAMPENLLKEGRITSRETMGEFIRSTMKQNKISANKAAFVLSNDTVFIKNVTVPEMTTDQLEYNLPFEFNDYITGELKDYVFDYAVVSETEEEKAEREKKAAEEHPGEDASPEPEEEEHSTSIDLMAVGTQRAVLEDAFATMRKAGMKLIISAPAISAYISLIRAQKAKLSQVADEYGILDLGNRSIRMYMFKGDRHVATRALEMGLFTLDDILAEAYGVDVHLAHTYLMANHDNCQQREECVSHYENIAVELMRALNFYRFSNPDSALNDLWLCGGGAVIKPLANTIGEMLNIELHPASELVPDGDKIEECNTFVQAIGIAMT